MTFHLLAKLGEYVINITEMEKENIFVIIILVAARCLLGLL